MSGSNGVHTAAAQALSAKVRVLMVGSRQMVSQLRGQPVVSQQAEVVSKNSKSTSR